MSFHSYGILRYSPKLLGERASAKWWAVLDCDPGLGRYYRELYWLTHHRCRKLMRPAWKEHITVIRDEEPSNKHLWDRYDREVIEFQIVPGVKDNGEYFWLTIACPRLLEIRAELGLARPRYDFHLSVGHVPP